MVAPKRKVSAVLVLFFVAPFVAEYLLGDLPLKLLPVMIVMAPMYGGGAVLIRDVARRAGRGWPTMLMLGAAYTLIAEGLVTQSLFNHDYLKMHMHLLAPAYIPALGIGGWWTLFMFNLHTFWSMGVSIALVESLFPVESKAPWLGRVGDSVVAVMFVLGAIANFVIGFKQNHFMASHAQLFSAALCTLLLIVSAFLLPALKGSMDEAMVPNSWITGAVALMFGLGIVYTPPTWGWGAASTLLALDAVFLILLTSFSRRTGWSELHTLSLAAGGALAYGTHAFTQRPMIGGLLWMRISNAVFFTCAVWLIWISAVGLNRKQRLRAGSELDHDRT